MSPTSSRGSDGLSPTEPKIPGYEVDAYLSNMEKVNLESTWQILIPSEITWYCNLLSYEKVIPKNDRFHYFQICFDQGVDQADRNCSARESLNYDFKMNMNVIN